MFVNRHIAKLRVDNSRILRTKNAKFSGYYFFYEHEHIGRVSNLQQCTFNTLSQATTMNPVLNAAVQGNEQEEGDNKVPH